MKDEDAETHIVKLGSAHAKLTWLKRHLKETQASIDKVEKTISEMEKHSAEAFATKHPEAVEGLQ